MAVSSPGVSEMMMNRRSRPLARSTFNAFDALNRGML